MPSASVKKAAVNHVEQQKDLTKHVAPNQIVLSKTAGGNISEYPIEFTKDSKYFFASVGSCVKVFSMATGAVVKVLSQSHHDGGHSDKITRVILNPKNHLQLYTASLDGTIKLWDYNDDILLKTYSIKAPIQHMVISPANPGYAYIIVKSGQDDSADNSIVYSFAFGEDETTPLRRICSLTDCTAIDITDDGHWLAFGARFKAYLWPINNETEDVTESQLREHVFTEAITTIKFRPHKPTLAVGDRTGKITLIENYISENSSDHIRSLLHWHHIAVRCLTFMGDGSYLLSGGEESVLVIWQLDTGHKQFLPRLGGSISSIAISPNHRFYCLGLDDNSIRLVNSVSQTIEQVIQGVQYAKADHALNPLSTGLIIEPRNHHVVLNGVQGSIQFYNATTDSHVMDLEVVPTNRVVRSGEKEVIHANVTHVAFLRSGEWMATVDMRDDKVTTPELFLKFWRWDPDTQGYKLHTRVDYPHTKPITSLTFSPVSRQGPMAITTSKDKTFKVWNLNELGRQGDGAAWMCRSVGVYRDSVPTTATFSEDGSILAVAFGRATTIWDPYVNSIQATLAQPNPEDVQKLSFLGDNCPYLIAKSKQHIYVWNLLTCKVWWSYKMSVDHFAVDTATNKFAVVRNNDLSNASRVVVFEPKSPVPLALQHLNFACRSIAWLPREQEEDDSVLLCLTNTYELSMFSLQSSSSKKETGTTAAASVSFMDGDVETSLLNDMYGKRENERETDEQTRIRLKTLQTMREEAMTANREDKSSLKRRDHNNNDVAGLSAPSHVLPNVETLFDSFMSSLMELRLQPQQEKEEEVDADKMDVDEEKVNNNVDEDDTFLQDTIIRSASEDFPSLSSYFSQELDQNTTKAKVTEQQESSSEDDSSDEEDPSKIDW